MPHVDPHQPPQSGFEIRDAVAILKRRKWIFAIPTLLILAVVVPVAFLLPREYQSRAIILIEQPDIPPDLVSSTVTTLADQRIQVIEQRFKATANLIRTIEKYDLYAEARETVPTSGLVAGMRDKIKVELISANVMDPRGGRPRKATIAFAVSFDYGDPATAQKVTSELVSWYLNENTRARQQQAQQTAEFLAAESAGLERTVRDLEGKLSQFKEKYAGSLPEELRANTEALARLEQELRDLDFRVSALADRRGAVDMELAYASTYAPPAQPGAPSALSPASRLKVAQAQLQSLKGRYADTHPDVIKLINEIGLIEAQLAEERKAAPTTDEASAGAKEGADNPRVVQLKAQLLLIDGEAKALAKRRQFLESEIVTVRDRLARTPLVEQDYRVLARTLENSQADYLAIRRKRLTADLGESLETEGRSERFDVIEPPTLPVVPERPKRLAIVGAGAAIALAMGAGMMILAELLDPTIRSRKYVVARTGVQPLAIVPYIRTRAETMRIWLRRLGVGTALAASIAGGLTYVHFKVKPLDVAIANLERRLESQVTRILH